MKIWLSNKMYIYLCKLKNIKYHLSTKLKKRCVNTVLKML
jgi:hypothetical protein